MTSVAKIENVGRQRHFVIDVFIKLRQNNNLKKKNILSIYYYFWKKNILDLFLTIITHIFSFNHIFV